MSGLSQQPIIMDEAARRMDSCLQETLTEIRRATKGMTVEQLAWHPDGKWSAAEILEHLTLTFTGTAKGMQRVAESGVEKAAAATVQQRVAAFVVTTLGFMPSGRKSPEMVEPKTSDPVNAVAQIERELINMDGMLAEVEKRVGNKVRIPHPILGPLTIVQWRTFHRVHTKHHMKQIEQLKLKTPPPLIHD